MEHSPSLDTLPVRAFEGEAESAERSCSPSVAPQSHSSSLSPMHSTSQTDPVAHPAPRVTSLFYRGEPRSAATGADYRPQPTRQDQLIVEAFERLNDVDPGRCWLTAQYSTDGAHMLPHAESNAARLLLWVQLMELVPVDSEERNKWKVSPSNLVPLNVALHRCLADGKQRRALLRPARKDLHRLVQVLETGLCAAEESLSTEYWKPDWRRLLEERWNRKLSAGPDTAAISCQAYEYQVEFFDLNVNEIVTAKKSALPGYMLTMQELPGKRTYPNSLTTDLGTFFAPLCILSLTAVAVSQLAYLAKSAGKERWLPSFLEDLEVMSYIVEIMGSDSPNYFRKCARPSCLAFERPPPPAAVGHSETVRRKWPEALWPERSKDGKEIFSSSPLRNGRTARASTLYGPLEPISSSPVGQPEVDGDRHQDGDSDDDPAGPPRKRQKKGKDDDDTSEKSDAKTKQAENTLGDLNPALRGANDAPGGGSSMQISGSMSSGTATIPTSPREAGGSSLANPNVLPLSADGQGKAESIGNSFSERAERMQGQNSSGDGSEGEWDDAEGEKESNGPVDVFSSEWQAEGKSLARQRLQLYRELIGQLEEEEARDGIPVEGLSLAPGMLHSLVLVPDASQRVACGLKSLDRLERLRERQWERWGPAREGTITGAP